MHKKSILIIAAAICIAVLIVGLKIPQMSSVLFQFLFNKSIDLKKTDGKINILLLGIGGGDHDGPNLSDTIMLASLNPSKNNMHLISIPRDLWISELQGKINSAYADGEETKKGGGLILAKAIVAKVLDQKVDYAVRIDFNGFVKAVDMVGGLDIVIDRTFDDNKYPDESRREDLCDNTPDEATIRIATESPYMVFPCRYLHVHFEKGNEHMDGKRALIFVRSRYAGGEEGTDFARSNRQEKVINAFKEKMLSPQTIFNPARVINLYAVLQESIDTDIKQDEFDDFIRLANKMSRGAGSGSARKSATIQNAVLDYGDEEKKQPGLLMHPDISSDYNNEWVLIPRSGNNNFEEIQKYVDCEIKVGTCPIPK